MNQQQLKRLAEALDERFTIALERDEEMGNKEGKNFLPNNPDYIYYKGMLEALGFMGYYWERKNNKHYIGKLK